MAQQTKTPKREEPPVAEEGSRRGWPKTSVDGLAVKTWILIGVLIAGAAIGFGAW